MTRRHRARLVVAAAALAVAVVAGPTEAQDTGVVGQVDSVIELSLQRTAPDRVQATVSATVPGTALSVSQAGRPTRALGAYAGPVTDDRVTVRTTVPDAGVVEQTITFGPQTP